MKRLILSCVVALLLASPALAWQESTGGVWWYIDASYGGYHNSVPLVIEIDGNPDTGQLFAIGGSITITGEISAYAAMCGWDNEAYTEWGLDVSGPSGTDSDTDWDYVYSYEICAEINNTAPPTTATITYPLTAPGVHTVYMYSDAQVAYAGSDVADDFVDAELMFVVYDPTGGFVTGGGWIYSPAGAFKPDPSLAGKASFGFVSKYKKGATVPTGNTEFQFKAGDLNFHSSSYDWLLVTGSNYARFKGTGTINGSGEYKFMIWAGDDNPDTFRIKIWEENGGEVVVYDNGFDQAIGGGSIIIHTK
ncbi:MAG: hypothetical protein CEE38_02530 [Planctomycetes bacterium B3_Pla]|nr:MAG: hypothetical protein CEE38_02530 [Planctomycetes bacterium B3_Pla]